ncbi:AMP-binding protein [Streptomyces sp. NPDC048611]|uniref:(2,3-dihydroxybenzoyl)adenylate synthase n=1 Tax=Streptomyces sp. NPDC048611 TaxID=3155635 RepID=UPI003439104E
MSERSQTPEAPALMVTPQPERARAYRERGWWQPEMLESLVLRQGAYPADAEAVAGPHGRLTREELAAAVHACARRLAAAGIGHGDSVLVQLPNDIELVILVLALISLGAPPALALPALRRRELDHILGAARPVALAVPARQRRFDHVGLARELRAEHASVRMLLVHGQEGYDTEDLCDWLPLEPLCAPDGQSAGYADTGGGTDVRSPEDTALYLLSSGTTGPPKLIPRTHEAFGHVIRASADVSGLTPESVYLAVMPATHSFAFGHPGILGALASGGRTVLSSPDNADAALALVEAERVTHCALAPAVALRWLAAAESSGYDLSSLDVLQVGGARLDRETAQRLSEGLGCRVQQVYGMSEGLLNFTRLDEPSETAWTTQGRPSSQGDEILIADGEGRTAPEGATGELLTRGPSVIAGYHGGAAADSFTPDGYYRTGDLVYRHPSGNLVVAGRIKDVINRGGEKIPADELEAVAAAHPAVRSAAAVAMPHPVLGEAVCLYIVAEDGAPPTLRGLRRFLEDRGLARFKLPERLVPLDALPLVGVGKVDKASLRADIRGRLSAEAAGHGVETAAGPAAGTAPTVG